jgi:uncharacterized protein (DUF2235 family)
MGKRIVICCDGTWNTRNQRYLTNVAKLAIATVPTAPDGVNQIVFYDAGVGTGSNWLDRLTGGAFGGGLNKNVEDAYRFLVDNYQTGDELFFFGFSRGAYTARSAVGLIRKCGVLHKMHAGQFGRAYNIYRKRDPTPDTPEATAFRRDFSQEVEIKFIGVWDTVGSLGIPAGIGIPFDWLRLLTKGRHEFHNLELSGIVKNAYQAVGIDERRAPYEPALWANISKEGQTVEQVWFTGVHMDVGGGYEDAGLSNTAFLWIKEKAAACGLAFDEEYVSQHIVAAWNGTLHDSRNGIFKLMKSRDRAMGTGKAANEAVHPAAAHRTKSDPSYKTNLTAYLQQPAARIAEVVHKWLA